MSTDVADWIDVEEFEPSRLVKYMVIVGLVCEFCDDQSLLRVRLVCRAWNANLWISWPPVFATIAESRATESRRISLRQAIETVFRIDATDRDWIEEAESLRIQSKGSFVVAVEENERYIPGLGFTKVRLARDPPRWRQLCGIYCGEILDLHCAHLAGGAWQGPWTLAKCGKEVCDDGWCYGATFTTLGTDQPILHRLGPRLVRRRVWLRPAMLPL